MDAPLEEVRRRIGEPGFLLVNVLSRQSFAAERIPGSISLPLVEIGDRAALVIPDLDTDVVTYCASPT